MFQANECEKLSWPIPYPPSRIEKGGLIRKKEWGCRELKISQLIKFGANHVSHCYTST
jgi:hypothetical protein